MMLLLNWMAWIGWSGICLKVCVAVVLATTTITTAAGGGGASSSSSSSYTTVLQEVQPYVLLLEGICFLEVGRIVLGNGKGNFVLGIILHTIRLVTICLPLTRFAAADDDDDDETWLGILILGSWSVTEVCRYPMYLFPNQARARSVRMLVPMLTFPVGAWAEGYSAYLVLLRNSSTSTSSSNNLGLLSQLLLGGVVGINGLLGPTMAYPALLQKGIPYLFGNHINHTKKKKARVKSV